MKRNQQVAFQITNIKGIKKIAIFAIHCNEPVLKFIMIEENLLLKCIIEGMQEKKAKSISVIQLTGLSGTICDYFVICEGNTPTMVSAITESVEEVVKRNRAERPISVHGKESAEWVGMDYGDIMVHIFVPHLRSFYDIDNLWEDAKIKHIE